MSLNEYLVRSQYMTIEERKVALAEIEAKNKEAKRSG
jgi:hypothetical protein